VLQWRGYARDGPSTLHPGFHICWSRTRAAAKVVRRNWAKRGGLSRPSGSSDRRRCISHRFPGRVPHPPADCYECHDIEQAPRRPLQHSVYVNRLHGVSIMGGVLATQRRTDVSSVLYG
jgi:hypothetical protein